MTAPHPRLLALATAVPDHPLRQAEVAERARRFFSGAEPGYLDRMIGVFGNAGIDTRYSSVPPEWYDTPHGLSERNNLYLHHATRLLETAARDCLDRAGLRAQEIDSVVTISTTGIATPSLDAMLMGRLGLRRDVRRLPVFGLGCAGGVLGLSRAADLARADPKRRVLLLVVELCALCFRLGDQSKSNVVATALFGDGAVAAVVSCDGEGPALRAGGEFTWPDTLDVMGWDVVDDGLKAIFSKDIPNLVRRDLREAAGRFLDGEGLTAGDVRHFVCHPGGTKVLTALEEAFDLTPGKLHVARGVLRDYGNMSAVTVLFVLERQLRADPHGLMLLTALGPGFTAGFQLLDAAA